jgi:hypothetical protein
MELNRIPLTQFAESNKDLVKPDFPSLKQKIYLCPQLGLFHSKTLSTPIMNSLSNNTDYDQLIQTIGQTLQAGRIRAYRMAQQIAVQTRWELGRHIVEFEQRGYEKAEYGSFLLDRLAKDLSLTYGKGFSRTNVFFIRKLYLLFPKVQTVSELLSWSHYCELLTLEDELERGFYEQQSIRERWSVSELKRQKKSALFLRLAKSRDKAGILKLAAQGQIPETPDELLRDPYILGDPRSTASLQPR